MRRPILWAMPIALILAGSLHAQNLTEVNDLKGKIWEAELAQRNFAAGLRHCNELNGTNFYFDQRDRVLNLQDYRRSLDNLVAAGMFNQETRRPWNKQDADARWAQVQKRRPPIKPTAQRSRACHPSDKNSKNWNSGGNDRTPLPAALVSRGTRRLFWQPGSAPMERQCA
jgi:hypothetical protein